MYNCVVNNDGARGSAVCAIGAPWLRICCSQLRAGSSGLHALDSTVLISESTVRMTLIVVLIRIRSESSLNYRNELVNFQKFV